MQPPGFRREGWAEGEAAGVAAGLSSWHLSLGNRKRGINCSEEWGESLGGTRRQEEKKRRARTQENSVGDKNNVKGESFSTSSGGIFC